MLFDCDTREMCYCCSFLQLETLHRNLDTNQREFETILADVEGEHEDEIARHKKEAAAKVEEKTAMAIKAQNKLSSEVTRKDNYKKKWKDSQEKEMVRESVTLLLLLHLLLVY